MPTGVVYQAINPSVTGDRGVDQIPNVFSLAYVAIDKGSRAGSVGFGLQGSHCRQSLRFVVAANNDSGAGLNKGLRTTLADPAAATGDNRYLVALERACHLHLRYAAQNSWLTR